MMDESLYQDMNEMVAHTSTSFVRYLFSQIPWDDRMIGIVGPRGVGKSTMLLQRIKQERSRGRYLYVSADSLYFNNHTLVDLAGEFVRDGGTHFFVDEVHKYRGWSRELKNIHDSHPDLHIVFTGSSVLDIMQGEADLSRRALMRTLHGLSFREYLQLEHGIVVPVADLETILHGEVKIEGLAHPLPLMREYLKRGYYPFSHVNDFYGRLRQIVGMTLENDIPQYADMRPSTARKLGQMLAIVSGMVPYKPNMSALAAEVGVSKNNVQDYLVYLERAGLIAQLRDSVGGLRLLGKVEKVYIDNPTLMYALAEGEPNIGCVRETFFLNQMRVRQRVTASEVSDFKIGKYTFEVGGQKKTRRQVEDVADAWLVKDDIEYASPGVVPLWMFGLNY